MLAFFKITFLNLAFLSTGHPDSTNIEQAAFDEFISRVDSIVLMTYPKRKYFQKDSSKIYFSGKTGLYSAMPFVLNRMSRKMDFIIIDSAKDYAYGKDSWIYPEKGNRKIVSNAAFVIEAKKMPDENSLNAGDLRLFMSNRYYHNGFFYVKFVITQDAFNLGWYYKLNIDGKVIDSVITASVY